MSNITKRDLVIQITDQLGSQNMELTQKDVHHVVQAFITHVTDSLAKGDNVVLRNFGTFEVREFAEKIGRNPKNPVKSVVIPARASVKFKPGKEMKEKVATVLSLIRERDNNKHA